MIPVRIRRVLTIIYNDLLLQLQEPLLPLVFTGLPILLMWILEPTFQLAISAEAGRVAPAAIEGRGAAQVVPGMAAMFGLQTLYSAGYFLFREHIWNTWHRLVGGATRTWEVYVAKLVVPVLLACMQLTVLFAAGKVLFDLEVAGPLSALVMVAISMVFVFVGVVMLIFVAMPTLKQFDALAQLVAVMFAGFGGAIVPANLLPDVASDLASLVPTYWAMKGFEQVIVDGSGAGDVGMECLVLVGMGGLLLLAAVILQVVRPVAKRA